MNSLVLLPKLLLAGGASFLGTLQLPPDVEMINHTLAAEKIPAQQVVCRDRWGTPMLPDGKGSYSVIAPLDKMDKRLIAQSLWIPPVSGVPPTPTPSAQLAPRIIGPSAAPSTASPSATPSVGLLR